MPSLQEPKDPARTISADQVETPIKKVDDDEEGQDLLAASCRVGTVAKQADDGGLAQYVPTARDSSQIQTLMPMERVKALI